MRWALLLLAILSAAAYLRLYNIGAHGFWTDELFHVFAARSYLDNGTLQVPWLNREYTRALPVTLITASAFKMFGESETSGRVFFALSNVLFIGVAAFLLRFLFSRAIALLFAVASAFSVVGIQLSQECRMYTLFQLLYFLMSVAFLLGIDPATSGRWRRGPGLMGRLDERSGMNSGLLVLAVVLGGVSLLLQPLVVNFLFVVVAYCVTMLGYEARRTSLRDAFRSRYAGTMLALTAIVAAAWLVRRESVMYVVRIAAEAPSWNMPTRDRLGFYHRVLLDSHPYSWALYPLGAFALIRRYGRHGLFFVLSFAVLFPFHCFVFGRKSERYIFYILPFLVIAGAAAVELLIAGATRIGTKLASSRPRWQRQGAVAIVAALILAFAVPTARRIALDAAVEKFPDWKHLDPELVRAVSRATAITTDRWGYSYYFTGQPIILDSGAAEADEGLIRTVDDLERFSERHPDYYLVTYRSHLNSPSFVSPEIRAYILREMVRVDDAKNDVRIMAFARRRPASALAQESTEPLDQHSAQALGERARPGDGAR